MTIRARIAFAMRPRIERFWAAAHVYAVAARATPDVTEFRMRLNREIRSWDKVFEAICGMPRDTARSRPIPKEDCYKILVGELSLGEAL